MNELESPLSPPALSPPLQVSPARRIEEMGGDPTFMTSLARGLAVIDAFHERKRQLTIAQISHRTGIPRAAVRRCLHTLVKLGYVGSDDGRTYTLLPKVLTLGHAYLSSTPLAVAAQPFLDRLSEQLREACSLATLEGDEALYLACTATAQRFLSVEIRVGTRLPAYCTSLGQVLLAALDAACLDEYLAGATLAARTSRTLCEPQALRERLDQVRAQGWCLIDQELEAGLRSIAVPVHDAEGRVLAAMSISGHAARVSRAELEGRYLPALQAASRELSAQLLR
ncbi:transcriptional regulator, IclR family [Geopseudomonas sagittaria]|uniref:Transcriptional regulator, IclR family n=1 Tax=Geopseudomonas sagittaria TaxID=1135990 RepID=A0A1I5YVL5_9GAMM|nr:IclR family transcriptional regulator C-terminal domain-containing protein [Pseudomonas sagittaria]MCM2331949.1 helix-turn-helix domain-containing protein [Pseudomonas sagittaria]SFQ47867.1 transcriptional regulator, IclR family [Pseudomonas sagittaria]